MVIAGGSGGRVHFLKSSPKMIAVSIPAGIKAVPVNLNTRR